MWGSFCPEGYADLSQGWLGEYRVTLGTHLLVCQMSPKQVWSQHLVVGVLLFSQCKVAWRSFPQARGSGCWSFDSPWCFISKCGSSVSARFFIHRAHAVCFHTLVAILDPPFTGISLLLQIIRFHGRPQNCMHLRLCATVYFYFYLICEFLYFKWEL
jgi:hypothetical protein